jgi:hypothetical protein
MTHSAHAVLPRRPAGSQTEEPGTAEGEDVALVEEVEAAGRQSGPASQLGSTRVRRIITDGDRSAENEQLSEMPTEQGTTELVLRRPRGGHRGVRIGVAGDVGFGQESPPVSGGKRPWPPGGVGERGQLRSPPPIAASDRGVDAVDGRRQDSAIPRSARRPDQATRMNSAQSSGTATADSRCGYRPDPRCAGRI